MKNPLQTLLIIFALGLCGLCARQWYGQVQQQKQLDALAQSNYDQTVAIQGYTNSISATDHQIAQMDARLTELRGTVQSNQVVIFALRSESNRLTSQVAQYSNTVVLLESRLKQADDGIVRQNEAVKTLVQERDEYVTRLNQSIKDRNEIVAKYNDLVKQMEALQAVQTNQTKKP